MSRHARPTDRKCPELWLADGTCVPVPPGPALHRSAMDRLLRIGECQLVRIPGGRWYRTGYWPGIRGKDRWLT